jgi:hypothetical protein
MENMIQSLGALIQRTSGDDRTWDNGRHLSRISKELMKLSSLGTAFSILTWLSGAALPGLASIGMGDSGSGWLDGRDPVVQILEPAASTQYLGGTTVPLSWSIEEGNLVVSIARIRIDGAIVDSLTLPAGENPYDWPWLVPQIVASFCFLEVEARDLYGNVCNVVSERFSILPSYTGVDQPPDPLTTSLSEPRPNPFNPLTRFECRLASEGQLSLAVYDLQGRLVRRLAEETLGSGLHSYSWNGTDDRGHRVASGSYLIRLAFSGPDAHVTSVRKVVLLP